MIPQPMQLVKLLLPRRVHRAPPDAPRVKGGDSMANTATYSDTPSLAAWNAALSEGSSAAARITALDSKIAVLDAQLNALTGAGSVRMVWGTYVGTGSSGSEHPNSLSFAGRPLSITVRSADAPSVEDCLILRYGMKTFHSVNGTHTSTSNKAIWNGNTVSWYTMDSTSPITLQMNYRNVVYNYIAVVGM